MEVSLRAGRETRGVEATVEVRRYGEIAWPHFETFDAIEWAFRTPKTHNDRSWLGRGQSSKSELPLTADAGGYLIST